MLAKVAMVSRKRLNARLLLVSCLSIILFVLLILPMIFDFKLYQFFMTQHSNNTEANKCIEHTKILKETFSNEWLNRKNSLVFRRYSNKSDCPSNPYRNHLSGMLRFWIMLAKKHNIRYFLTYGSLLGAWRDGDIIPYDFDMDIRMHVDDLPKLFPLRQKRNSWDPYTDPGYHIYFTRDWELPYPLRRDFSCNGELATEKGFCAFTNPSARLINLGKHMDIFVYYTYQNVVQFIPKRPMEFIKSEIYPLVKCKFLDETTWCPRNPKHILDRLYERKLSPGKICKNKNWVDKDY